MALYGAQRTHPPLCMGAEIMRLMQRPSVMQKFQQVCARTRTVPAARACVRVPPAQVMANPSAAAELANDADPDVRALLARLQVRKPERE